MNILIIGSGGREHALAWKIKQSGQCEDLYVAPGNAGTAQMAINVSINSEDFEAVKDLVLSKAIELVIVGPEAPLVAGISDFFQSDDDLKNIAIIGPGSKGAMLEGSKDFSKDFMARHGVPTAQSATFTEDSLEEGLQYLETKQAPFVLKADGLAAGKGVLICQTLEEAREELRLMLSESKFGEASRKVVIEDFLDGIELSVFVLTDGSGYQILPEAKDYKRIGENDSGPNTGGMGAVSPVHFAHPEFLQKVEEKVVIPTIEGLKKDDIPYVGFIFIGLMNVQGEPFVVEYNVRMGDPETQVVMPRIQSDLVDLLTAAWDKKLDDFKLEITDDYATTVVMVANGYPGSYPKGDVITGLDGEAANAIVFHAGTKPTDGQVVTNGGRVLAITGSGSNIPSALESAYARVSQINWEGVNYRKDIGQDLLRLLDQ